MPSEVLLRAADGVLGFCDHGFLLRGSFRFNSAEFVGVSKREQTLTHVNAKLWEIPAPHVGGGSEHLLTLWRNAGKTTP